MPGRLTRRMRVRLYLNRPLFTLPADGHVPRNVAVVLGTLVEQSAGGFTVRADGWLDEQGRSLGGEPRTLIVPVAKVDHVLVEG